MDELYSYHLMRTKFNIKYMKDLRVRPEILKLLEENTENLENNFPGDCRSSQTQLSSPTYPFVLPANNWRHFLPGSCWSQQPENQVSDLYSPSCPPFSTCKSRSSLSHSIPWGLSWTLSQPQLYSSLWTLLTPFSFISTPLCHIQIPRNISYPKP